MLNVELNEEVLTVSTCPLDDAELGWSDACAEVIAALPASCRELVRQVLHDVHAGGAGLREWVSAIAYRGGQIPASIPLELVQVYLSDPEAVPLHDCEQCGLAVPVRPSRVHGLECEPDEQYFPHCPVCGGRTGLYCYWSKQAESASPTNLLRRRNPR